MNKKKALSVTLATVFGATALFGIGTKVFPNALEDNSAPVVHQPTMKSSTDKTTINLLSGDIYDFASKYEVSVDWPLSMQYSNGHTKYEPTPAHVTWSDSKEANYYTVKLSQNADLSNAETYAVFTNSLEIEDLFMGTKYYYQITAHRENEKIKSQIYSFETAYLPRTIALSSTYRDTNSRDIGGYYTEDKNYRVKQGVAYRGAEVKSCTQEAKEKLLYQLGIKTELALHNVSTPDLGESVNYVYVESPHYVNYGGIHYAMRAKDLATALLTFANADNYPIYFHCQLGRDRTGTLAFLLNALCGVGIEDLYLDFELSYLSNYGSIGWDGNGTPKAKVGQFERMLRYINEGVSKQDAEHDKHGDPVRQDTIVNPYFKTTDTTLAERTATFLKGQLAEYGINDTVINAIRNNLLEKV